MTLIKNNIKFSTTKLRSMTMVKMTKSEFRNWVSALISGTTTGSIEVDTEVKLPKSNNPFGGSVRCHQTLNGVFGFNYEKSVNRQAEKDGLSIRIAQSRTWGKVDETGVFVDHNGKEYIQLKVEKQLDNNNTHPKYYLADTGAELDAEAVRNARPKSKSSTQEGLSKEVIVRDINLDNVKSVKMFGQVIEITN